MAQPKQPARSRPSAWRPILVAAVLAFAFAGPAIQFGYTLDDHALDEALPHLEVSVRLEAGDPWAHLALGQCYTEQKRWPEARREYEATLSIDASSAGALRRLAEACREMGDPAGARNAEARLGALPAPRGAQP